AADKPTFRSAFRQRRCLIPADGFFEWRQQKGGKQPFYIRRADAAPFAFAGLWEHWERDGKVIESCTVLTTEANPLIRPLHDRMPVLLSPRDFAPWLDPSLRAPALLRPLLGPYPEALLTAYPVETRVNSPKNDEPACLTPLPALF